MLEPLDILEEKENITHISYTIHKSSLEMPHNYSGKNMKLPAGKNLWKFLLAIVFLGRT